MAGLSLDMGDIEAPTESTPLKGNDLDDEDEPLGAIPESTTKEKLVAAAACVGVGTNVAAMVVEGGISTKVSGIIGTLVAPYSALQQQKITETKGQLGASSYLIFLVGRPMSNLISYMRAGMQ